MGLILFNGPICDIEVRVSEVRMSVSWLTARYHAVWLCPPVPSLARAGSWAVPSRCGLRCVFLSVWCTQTGASLPRCHASRGSTWQLLGGPAPGDASASRPADFGPGAHSRCFRKALWRPHAKPLPTRTPPSRAQPGTMEDPNERPKFDGGRRASGVIAAAIDVPPTSFVPEHGARPLRWAVSTLLGQRPLSCPPDLLRVDAYARRPEPHDEPRVQPRRPAFRPGGCAGRLRRRQQRQRQRGGAGGRRAAHAPAGQEGAQLASLFAHSDQVSRPAFTCRTS